MSAPHGSATAQNFHPPAHGIFSILSDLDSATLRGIIAEARRRKNARAGLAARLPDRDMLRSKGRMLAMIFDRPSTRTRISFDVGMQQLGGQSIMLAGAETQLGRGEIDCRHRARAVPLCRCRSCFARSSHDALRALAENSGVPVINGLTKSSHPCQVMADVMTFEEAKGPIRGRTIAWTGDCNNVCASWIHAAARFDFALRVATPEELAPPAAIAQMGAQIRGGNRIHQRSGARGVRRRLRRHRHLDFHGRSRDARRRSLLQALSGR